VVIVDSGIILTNLHVVSGAKRVTVKTYDGSESDVDLIRVYPENDLAVIKARKVPDDLESATLGSTGNLRPGDEVVAVGFPFGIGVGLGRCGFRARPQLPIARGQADDWADPVRCGGQPRKFRRPTHHDGRRGDRYRHGDPEPDARAHFIGIGFAATIESAGGAVGIPPF
jgi:hypothetical protein